MVLNFRTNLTGSETVETKEEQKLECTGKEKEVKSCNESNKEQPRYMHFSTFSKVLHPKIIYFDLDDSV